jgi:SAM-dependent methyltransferase
MTEPRAYEHDLAYIHDQGFGGFARDSAPGLLALLDEAGIHDGRIVDLGCGSGIWARALADAGFQVMGVDISPAMIDIARRRVPEAEFHVGSFVRFEMPASRAVTALGEVFNYLFDTDHSPQTLQAVCRGIFDALSPGGVLIFDIALPGRSRGLTQAFREGEDWTCLVELAHDELSLQLSRRIVTFRKVGDGFRRHEETHRLQLFEEASVTEMLETIGFQVRPVLSYGTHRLPPDTLGFVARKPGS